MRSRSLAGLALAGVGLLAACTDPTAAPSGRPQLLVSSLAVSVPERQLIICKAGNAAGVFTFDWSITGDGSPIGTVSGTVTGLATGACAVAYTVSEDNGNRYSATVTERTPPTGWALTGITGEYDMSLANPPTFPNPDVPNRTVTGVVLTNDLGVKITFTNAFTPPPPPGPSCTLTQGFWKNHQELWDAAGEKVVWTGQSFFNSGKTYAEMYTINAAGGNSYSKLAHQYIAAKLNLNGGSDPTINGAISQAEALFAGHPAGSFTIKNGTWNSVATALDDYNNGKTGPGHCGS
ncbi:MAG: hypothetical protein H7Z74_00755 [Anaerolineae bacterium]|nr:hypothetical protein [Gemmatimonadaceae bacterium]